MYNVVYNEVTACTQIHTHTLTNTHCLLLSCLCATWIYPNVIFNLNAK